MISVQPLPQRVNFWKFSQDYALTLGEYIKFGFLMGGIIAFELTEQMEHNEELS